MDGIFRAPERSQEMDVFYQSPPELGDQYQQDPLLRRFLKRKLDPGVFEEMEPQLQRMGRRAATDLLELSQRAEAEPPRHIPYDAWGRRIDQIATSSAWQAFKEISAREGLVALAYERRHGWQSRICQFALLYLFHPSSAFYTCPLAMTDGAAKAIELYGGEFLKTRAFSRLTSRAPAQFWTSGQWMTERSGGSDVGGTSTIAKSHPGGFKLYGSKWFTSATTSEMAMTLARIEGDPLGSSGLSLFSLELREEGGGLNHICVHRLKEKLGTRALPTAELTLDGTRAVLVGGPGDGVKKISSLLNITRLYNAICAVASMRRAIALAKSYAAKRVAFGQPLCSHPLHQETLARLEVTFRACFHLTFDVVELLGREEAGEAGPETRALARLLTPIAKLYTAKAAIQVCSEIL
ncbi:MAG: acyl-CoA dehydrogenase family protein, partial [Acidobacteriota bacterium]